MESYAKRVFSPDEVRALRVVEEIVASFPNVDDDGRLIRCHEVARAIYDIGALAAWQPVVTDGQFEGAEHSWLHWRGRDSCPRILDPYAVGSLPQVQLLHVGFGIWRSHYKPGGQRTDIRSDVVKLLVRSWMKRPKPIREELATLLQEFVTSG